VNKNGRSDPRVGCKPPSNLLKLIEKDIKKELEEFENSFERDEIVNI
jgi:predicted DNA-binding transcriptional regulator